MAFIWESTEGFIDETGLYTAPFSKAGIHLINASARSNNSEATGSAIAFTPLLPGLIGWWPGENSAIDLINENDGASSNGPSYAPGIVGQAFSFDGLDDYVSMGDISDFEITNTNSMTITGWFKTSRQGHTGYLVSKADVFSPDFGWYIYIWDGGGLEFALKDNDSGVAAGTRKAVNDGEWHYFAAVHEGDTGRIMLYLDGTIRDTTTVVSQ